MGKAIIAIALVAVAGGPLAAATMAAFPASLGLLKMEATSARKPVLYFRLGDFTGTLEKTTLGQAQRVLGGQIYEEGQTAQAKYVLCYSLTLPRGLARVWLTSDAEMGGADHAINSVAAESLSPRSPAPLDCPLLARRYVKFSIGDGIRLSMAPDEVTRIMGPPSNQEGVFAGTAGRVGYAYSKPVDPADPVFGKQAGSSVMMRDATISDDLVIRAAAGRVNGLFAHRVTAY